MKRSTERMLTTHCGSLARPPALLEMMYAKERGQPYNPEAFASTRTDRRERGGPQAGGSRRGCGVRRRAGQGQLRHLCQGAPHRLRGQRRGTP